MLGHVQMYIIPNENNKYSKYRVFFRAIILIPYIPQVATNEHRNLNE